MTCMRELTTPPSTLDELQALRARLRSRELPAGMIGCRIRGPKAAAAGLSTCAC